MLKSLNDKKRIVRLLIGFFIPVIIGITITCAYVTNCSQLEVLQMEQLAGSNANRITNLLTEQLYKTNTIKVFVQQSNGQIEDFNKIASTIIDSPVIKNILIAPDGVVKYVYPIEGNELVLGLDFFSESAGNKEAILARDTGTLVMGGPFALVQGQQALVGRMPVQLNGKFWGIVSVTLNYPQVLELVGLDELQSKGFAFEIWRIDPDTGKKQTIAQSNYDYNKNTKFVEYPMEILNAKWHFKLSPIRRWYEFPETWMLVAFSIFSSILIAFLVLHNYDLNKMRKNLERISTCDSLTNVNNRLGGIVQLEKLITAKQKFILAYIDLNKFKRINDKYGHNCGDRVLQYFTGLIFDSIDDTNHIFARIGGDEFILAFKGTDDIAVADAFFCRVSESITDHNFIFANEKIVVSYSVGYAKFPKDSDTIDGLLMVADSNMYRKKKQNVD